MKKNINITKQAPGKKSAGKDKIPVDFGNGDRGQIADVLQDIKESLNEHGLF